MKILHLDSENPTRDRIILQMGTLNSGYQLNNLNFTWKAADRLRPKVTFSSGLGLHIQNIWEICAVLLLFLPDYRDLFPKEKQRAKASSPRLLRPPNTPCSGFLYFRKGGSGHPSKLSSETSNIFLLPFI